jgi:hypothetical protein
MPLKRTKAGRDPTNPEASPSTASRSTDRPGRAMLVRAMLAPAPALAMAMVAAPAQAVDLAVPGTPGAPQISLDSTWSGNTLGVRYADLNATMAPFGSIYENGVRIRLSGSWVGYNYVYSTDPWTLAWGNVLEGSWQVGYGVNTERISAIGLVGLAIDESQNAGVRSTSVGAAGTMSVAATPTDWSLVYASAQYSTISHGYLAQGKVGIKALGNAYVGIEGSLSGLIIESQSLVSQRSIGGHISNIQVGRAFFGVSSGYVYDVQLSGGAYVTGTFYIAF